ncbi:oxidoreductase [Pedobacter alpinus]|uniref:Oxidoreductase n=1 Tax=Pedobacter alpinus TaxID=1590643 RepID=A0ABW5TNV0_9SPHI
MTQKLAIVTGANAGLGFETSKVLVSVNYRIIMACRDVSKGLKAKELILKEFPNGLIDVLQLDLSSQNSVSKFADLVKFDFKHLDLLINNAGIMMTPYKKTADGFENQMATNYLGHFALTGLLLPLLNAATNARVINLSSLAHRWTGIKFDDVNFETGYDKKAAYGQSKFACLMFGYELDRRLKASDSNTISVVAHPGISNTGLFQFMPTFLKWLSPFIGQKAEDGALPIIFAALSNDLKGGEYIGPDGFNEWRGKPKIVDSNAASKKLADAKKLWDLSEKMVNVKYDF